MHQKSYDPEYRREVKRRARQLKRDKGECVRCKQPVEDGKTMCRKHLDIEAARTLDRYHAAVLESVCIFCGKDLPEDYAHRAHRECLDYYNEQKRERHALRKAASKA